MFACLVLFIISSCLITVICCVITRVRARDTQHTSARRPAPPRARPLFLPLFLSPPPRHISVRVCCARARCAESPLITPQPLLSARARAQSALSPYRGGTDTESTSIACYRSLRGLSRDSTHDFTTSRPPYHAPYGTHNSWLQRWPLRVITPSSGRCRSARRTRAAAAAARPPRPPVGRGASRRGPGPLAAPPPPPARSPRSR